MLEILKHYLLNLLTFEEIQKKLDEVHEVQYFFLIQNLFR